MVIDVEDLGFKVEHQISPQWRQLIDVGIHIVEAGTGHVVARNVVYKIVVGPRRRRSFSAIIFVKELFVVQLLALTRHGPKARLVLDMLEFRCAGFATGASLSSHSNY